MQITFGLRLDGERGWRPANRLGEPVLGPFGLLNLLETRIGLLRRMRACATSDAVLGMRKTLRHARSFLPCLVLDRSDWSVRFAPVVARRLVSARLERQIAIRRRRPDRRHSCR